MSNLGFVDKLGYNEQQDEQMWINDSLAAIISSYQKPIWLSIGAGGASSVAYLYVDALAVAEEVPPVIVDPDAGADVALLTTEEDYGMNFLNCSA